MKTDRKTERATNTFTWKKKLFKIFRLLGLRVHSFMKFSREISTKHFFRRARAAKNWEKVEEKLFNKNIRGRIRKEWRGNLKIFLRCRSKSKKPKRIFIKFSWKFFLSQTIFINFRVHHRDRLLVIFIEKVYECESEKYLRKKNISNRKKVDFLVCDFKSRRYLKSNEWKKKVWKFGFDRIEDSHQSNLNDFTVLPSQSS